MTADATPRQVSCQQVVELLTDYLEGALPADEVAAVEHHLALCPGCEHYLAQLRATIAALGTVPVETLSPQARNTLMQAFRDHFR